MNPAHGRVFFCMKNKSKWKVERWKKYHRDNGCCHKPYISGRVPVSLLQHAGKGWYSRDLMVVGLKMPEMPRRKKFIRSFIWSTIWTFRQYLPWETNWLALRVMWLAWSRKWKLPFVKRSNLLKRWIKKADQASPFALRTFFFRKTHFPSPLPRRQNRF